MTKPTETLQKALKRITKLMKLQRLDDSKSHERRRKPNFGWPFDNVNAIVLKGQHHEHH